MRLWQKLLQGLKRQKKVVEVTVQNKDLIFRAEHSSLELEDALDHCIDTIVRQIRKNKTKVEKKLRVGDINEYYTGDFSEDEEKVFDIVRFKTIDLKPQSVDEAILQMNMLGHLFYVYLNDETNFINVVYSRKDGGYGVIEPNIS